MDVYSYKRYRSQKKPHRAGRRFLTILILVLLCLVAYFLYQGFVAGNMRAISNSAADNANILVQDIATQSDNGNVIVMDTADLARGDLVLVNNAVTYPFPDGSNLVSVYDYKSSDYSVADMEVMVESGIMPHLNDMLEDFYRAEGLNTINVVSGYRSYDDQRDLYADSLATDGAEHTARYVANPGGSEHHTGLAVDLSIYYPDTGVSETFSGEGQYSWINENGWKYGFIQRYPSDKEAMTYIAEETWHYRYVGLPHAYLIKQNNMCLEEYLEFLKEYPWDGTHLTVECEGTAYEIYYCSGYEVHVPDSGVYSVSGNNMDGFIVTVCR